jgi:LacI family transcriptional regulator
VDLAVDHLYQLGHRRIAYMPHNVPDRHFLTETRRQAYLDSLLRRGLKPIDTYDQQIDIARHLDEYLAMPLPPTAVVVFSDAMSLLVVNRLVELGVELPGRMSVVSVESVVLYTFGFKRISGVLTPTEELGKAAVRLLIRQIETGEPAASVLIKPTFEDRETTAPPPADSPNR